MRVEKTALLAGGRPIIDQRCQASLQKDGQERKDASLRKYDGKARERVYGQSTGSSAAFYEPDIPNVVLPEPNACIQIAARDRTRDRRKYEIRRILA